MARIEAERGLGGNGITGNGITERDAVIKPIRFKRIARGSRLPSDERRMEVMGVFGAMTRVVLEAGRLDRPPPREHEAARPRLRLACVPALSALTLLLLGVL